MSCFANRNCAHALRAAILGAAAAALLLAPGQAAAQSAPGPAWSTPYIAPMPARLAPSTSPYAEYDRFQVGVANVGTAPTSGPITLTETLSPGLQPTAAEAAIGRNNSSKHFPCVLDSPGPQQLTCTLPEAVQVGQLVSLETLVDPGALAVGSPASLQLAIAGGTAPELQGGVETTIDSSPPPFGFLSGASGLGVSLTGADGEPATLAGSHPGELAVQLGFPIRSGTLAHESGSWVGTDGGVRDVRATLPPGVVLDPAAVPVVCPEVRLETNTCPDASAVGLADLQTNLGDGAIEYQSSLYAVVPPPGAAAAFSFNAAGLNIFPHILGGVAPGGSYALSATSNNIVQLGGHPIFGIRTQFWGDPSAEAYDGFRGGCDFRENTVCDVEPGQTPLLSMPTSCGGPLSMEASTDSWGHPGAFQTRSAPVTDSLGALTSVSGCNALPFEPTLSVLPTTHLADSPTGLDVDLHIPQSERLQTAATAHLKKAVVTLPAGLVVNPSSADGLAGCGSEEIGIEAASGVANGAPPACPPASRIGEVTIRSPLLAEYGEAGTKLETDQETGEAIPRPLPGSVYLAKPFDNPFDSLLAIYVAVEDPQSGTIVKLAGHVEPDPATGRLTTTFAQNPQLPFEDFTLSFFEGARGPLTTPPTCGTHTTTSTLTPWSTPEGADAHPGSPFQTTSEPGGGACPTSAGVAANAPAFSAGTIAPAAGAYSPFVLDLSRADGSQRLAGLDTTLPEGLTGKLAGIPYCSEAQIAQAKGREHPNQGALEKAAPSCPSSTEVGTVDVAAGSGPTPFHASGHAYLAGPYKGAPLSLVIITPAVAGPFDLGAVLVRTALYVDPETARIHAVSDPFPTILDGIPLDLRSVDLKMGRPDFTLNPTSCDPMAIVGTATSALGNGAALTSPFQVGGCSALGFKPKLAIHLKGGTRRAKNPSLRAVLTYPKGAYANIKSAQVALPHSEFLDQAHIKTICTRVQFAANQCPAASVYGHAIAETPLLDKPLEGPVYLRSSSNPLPDLVADLNGQIHVVLDGRVDSVHGGIRNTFEAVPDAPVSRFVLTMQGGKKGLLENSRNLCKSVNRATADFTAQNGKTYESRPLVTNSCKGKHGKHRRAHHKGKKGR
jgi:hypothetical protein